MSASNVGEVQAVRIAPNDLEGLLGVSEAPNGLVIFAHGSGSGRFSSRNNQVAEGLRRAGMATLLLDLLLPEEEDNRAKVFDIPLLAARLLEATRWARQQAGLRELPIGYFGASTGAGAALVAASHPDAAIAAVVSRGGRPDLAGSALGKVKAPTLLIVGGLDTQVIELNRDAMEQMHAEKQLVIVPGATHLFEEPGTLDQVTKLAADWFAKHLVPA
ncbi:MAG TPA: dienelactone hydrolase family protein [Noviherbaspirillum sp.]|uniref:dienelactone hydrolase family protein n=1 Tax=Noviherbaspirillum sp. TaxID=1926288 RepID=UPI002B4806C1|nr:dienelactone hydrolase family protein [Noviherbaspirillum sp.]HJV85994.1 dienelactone hydrolase family protein [Noviherbaspirillum sp.]